MQQNRLKDYHFQKQKLTKNLLKKLIKLKINNLKSSCIMKKNFNPEETLFIKIKKLCSLKIWQMSSLKKTFQMLLNYHFKIFILGLIDNIQIRLAKFYLYKNIFKHQECNFRKKIKTNLTKYHLDQKTLKTFLLTTSNQTQKVKISLS